MRRSVLGKSSSSSRTTATGAGRGPSVMGDRHQGNDIFRTKPLADPPKENVVHVNKKKKGIFGFVKSISKKVTGKGAKINKNSKSPVRPKNSSNPQSSSPKLSDLDENYHPNKRQLKSGTSSYDEFSAIANLAAQTYPPLMSNSSVEVLHAEDSLDYGPNDQIILPIKSNIEEAEEEVKMGTVSSMVSQWEAFQQPIPEQQQLAFNPWETHQSTLANREAQAHQLDTSKAPDTTGPARPPSEYQGPVDLDETILSDSPEYPATAVDLDVSLVPGDSFEPDGREDMSSVGGKEEVEVPLDYVEKAAKETVFDSVTPSESFRSTMEDEESLQFVPSLHKVHGESTTVSNPLLPAQANDKASGPAHSPYDFDFIVSSGNHGSDSSFPLLSSNHAFKENGPKVHADSLADKVHHPVPVPAVPPAPAAPAAKEEESPEFTPSLNRTIDKATAVSNFLPAQARDKASVVAHVPHESTSILFSNTQKSESCFPLLSSTHASKKNHSSIAADTQSGNMGPCVPAQAPAPTPTRVPPREEEESLELAVPLSKTIDKSTAVSNLVPAQDIVKAADVAHVTKDSASTSFSNNQENVSSFLLLSSNHVSKESSSKIHKGSPSGNICPPLPAPSPAIAAPAAALPSAAAPKPKPTPDSAPTPSPPASSVFSGVNTEFTGINTVYGSDFTSASTSKIMNGLASNMAAKITSNILRSRGNAKNPLYGPGAKTTYSSLRSQQNAKNPQLELSTPSFASDDAMAAPTNYTKCKSGNSVISVPSLNTNTTAASTVTCLGVGSSTNDLHPLQPAPDPESDMASLADMISTGSSSSSLQDAYFTPPLPSSSDSRNDSVSASSSKDWSLTEERIRNTLSNVRATIRASSFERTSPDRERSTGDRGNSCIPQQDQLEGGSIVEPPTINTTTSQDNVSLLSSNSREVYRADCTSWDMSLSPPRAAADDCGARRNKSPISQPHWIQERYQSEPPMITTAGSEDTVSIPSLNAAPRGSIFRIGSNRSSKCQTSDRGLSKVDNKGRRVPTLCKESLEKHAYESELTVLKPSSRSVSRTLGNSSSWDRSRASGRESFARADSNSSRRSRSLSPSQIPVRDKYAVASQVASHDHDDSASHLVGVKLVDESMTGSSSIAGSKPDTGDRSQEVSPNIAAPMKPVSCTTSTCDIFGKSAERWDKTDGSEHRATQSKRHSLRRVDDSPSKERKRLVQKYLQKSAMLDDNSEAAVAEGKSCCASKASAEGHPVDSSPVFFSDSPVVWQPFDSWTSPNRVQDGDGFSAQAIGAVKKPVLKKASLPADASDISVESSSLSQKRLLVRQQQEYLRFRLKQARSTNSSWTSSSYSACDTTFSSREKAPGDSSWTKAPAIKEGDEREEVTHESSFRHESAFGDEQSTREETADLSLSPSDEESSYQEYRETGDAGGSSIAVESAPEPLTLFPPQLAGTNSSVSDIVDMKTRTEKAADPPGSSFSNAKADPEAPLGSKGILADLFNSSSESAAAARMHPNRASSSTDDDLTFSCPKTAKDNKTRPCASAAFLSMRVDNVRAANLQSQVRKCDTVRASETPREAMRLERAPTPFPPIDEREQGKTDWSENQGMSDEKKSDDRGSFWENHSTAFECPAGVGEDNNNVKEKPMESFRSSVSFVAGTDEFEMEINQSSSRVDAKKPQGFASNKNNESSSSHPKTPNTTCTTVGSPTKSEHSIFFPTVSTRVTQHEDTSNCLEVTETYELAPEDTSSSTNDQSRSLTDESQESCSKVGLLNHDFCRKYVAERTVLEVTSAKPASKFPNKLQASPRNRSVSFVSFATSSSEVPQASTSHESLSNKPSVIFMQPSEACSPSSPIEKSPLPKPALLSNGRSSNRRNLSVSFNLDHEEGPVEDFESLDCGDSFEQVVNESWAECFGNISAIEVKPEQQSLFTDEMIAANTSFTEMLEGIIAMPATEVENQLIAPNTSFTEMLGEVINNMEENLSKNQPLDKTAEVSDVSLNQLSGAHSASLTPNKSPDRDGNTLVLNTPNSSSNGRMTNSIVPALPKQNQTGQTKTKPSSCEPVLVETVGSQDLTVESIDLEDLPQQCHLPQQSPKNHPIRPGTAPQQQERHSPERTEVATVVSTVDDDVLSVHSHKDPLADVLELFAETFVPSFNPFNPFNVQVPNLFQTTANNTTPAQVPSFYCTSGKKVTTRAPNADGVSEMTSVECVYQGPKSTMKSSSSPSKYNHNNSERRPLMGRTLNEDQGRNQSDGGATRYAYV